MLMYLVRVLVVLIFACTSFVPSAWAFCGFYVSKADTTLFNKASQVIIARDGKRTILTMANDFQGDVKNFAIVVPVPVTIKKEQVRIGSSKIIQRLDAFSAPRLVEYFDSDPCSRLPEQKQFRAFSAQENAAPSTLSLDKSLGVTIEERFTVGEYDILVLSAQESSGLETWLNQNGYKIPSGARAVLRPYIRENMKFFVAKVNLQELEKSDTQFLRPLLIAYESPKFILPIRLGMVNAGGEQDLVAYLLSPKGQVEITNYRTVKIPSDAQIPLYIKNEFAPFYKAMFANSYRKEGRNVAFLEYAWNMSSCDPCSADPLSRQELKDAGVFWESGNVFLTRLHVRYTRDKFPEDLQFRETTDQNFFQGRYVLNHPFKGETSCKEADNYRRTLLQRQEQEIQNIAKLTNWNIDSVRQKAAMTNYRPKNSASPAKFWERIWK